MENETELIRQQMVDTRTALSDKLEVLQEQVLGTVEGTTRTVTDTVETVQEAVQGTVSTVSEAVTDTVDSVKKTLDVTELTRNHPWLAVGGAVAVGYLGGRLLDSAPALSSTVASLGGVLGATGASPTTGFGNGAAYGQPAASSQGGSHLVGDVLRQLRELALGAVAGVVTDMIRQNAPAPLREHLDGISRSITSAIGAEPIHGLTSEGTAKAPR